MPSGFTQDNRFLKLTTPLGADKLLIESFSISERISDTFEMEVEGAGDERYSDQCAELARSGGDRYRQHGPDHGQGTALQRHHPRGPCRHSGRAFPILSAERSPENVADDLEPEFPGF